MTHTSTEQPEPHNFILIDDVAHQVNAAVAAEFYRLHTELKASQARVPLSSKQRRAIFDDLYPHGALPQTWAQFSVIVDAVERHTITQEKQG